MAWSFNPFTGNLDLVGGGAVVFEGEVETFADLPETIGDPPPGSSYLVRTSTGVWLVNRKQAGIWIRNPNNTGVRENDWTYGGDYPVNSVNGQTGTVSLTASSVGAAWALAVSSQFITGNTLLSAGRNRRITLSAINQTVNVDLPYSGNADGDVVTLVASSGLFSGSTLSIRTATGMSGGVPSTYAALATMTAPNQSFTFVSDGTAIGWSLRSVDTHTHDAAAITSGTFNNARINFAAPPSIGSTTPAAGSFTTLTATPAANTTALTSTGYSLTGSNAQSLVDLAGTWNTTGVPIAFKTNLTVTAAGSNSMYADFQAGGYSQFGVSRISSTSNALWLYNTNSGTNTNGVGANFERGFMRWSSNVLQIGTEKGGTGSARPLEFQTDGVTRMTIAANGNVSVGTLTTGNLFPAFCFSNVGAFNNGSVGWVFSWNGSVGSVSTGAGSTVVNLSVPLVRIGGTTASFPALRNSSTTLQVRLADDSAFAPFSASTITSTDSTTNTSSIAASGYGLTGSSAVSMVDLTGIWDTTGSPTLIKANVTDAASNAGSLLLDLQAGGTSRFSVSKNAGAFFLQNTFEQRNSTNAQEARVYGSYTNETNFQRTSVKTVRESTGALSGADYTTTIAIPAYSYLIGVTTRVTTAITGATSYDVGDGTDVDLWGAAIAAAEGSQSRTANFTNIAAVGPAGTSRTVKLTANGGSFTAGVVEICLHYLTTEAD